MRPIPSPARILVCGADYGSSYLRALSGVHGGGAFVIGVLGRGGASSRSRAQAMRVPCYTAAEQVPEGSCDAVCVAVGGAAGVALARRFLERDLPVLSEHPMHAADVRTLQEIALSRGVPWHLNSHFGDLPSIAPLIVGARRLATTGRPLFAQVTTNPRTLFSSIDLLARALGPLGEAARREESWHGVALVDENDFLVTVSGALAGTPTLVSCQRTTSARDDGSATLVSHHVQLGFSQGVLELGETFGPVVWRPNLSTHPARAPLWSVFPEAPPSTLESVRALRDAANRSAVEALLSQARGGPPLAWQRRAHQLDVAATWDALIQAIGPPVLVG